MIRIDLITPYDLMDERLQSAARELARSTPQDSIASPLHCVVLRFR
jgi:hypothetical protein